MAVSNVASFSVANFTQATFGTTAQAGDLIFVTLLAGGTQPTLPSGYTQLFSRSQPFSGFTYYWVVGYRIAAGGETSITLSTSAYINGTIYRTTTGALSIGANADNMVGSGTSATIPGLTLQNTSGSSWVLGSISSIGGTLTSTGGFTARSSGNAFQKHGDSNAGVSSWAASTATASSAAPWYTGSVEMKVSSGAANVTGSQTLAPVTHTSAISPVAKVTGDQTMAAVTQTGAISQYAVANVTGNQTLPAITQTSAIYKNFTTVSFTASTSWTVPAYAALFVTVEGGQGAGGSGLSGPSDPETGNSAYYPGGAGGAGGRSFKSYAPGSGPTPGSSVTLTLNSGSNGLNRFASGTQPTAYTGYDGGNAYVSSDGDSNTYNVGQAGAPGDASGGDTNTTGGSAETAPKITLQYVLLSVNLSGAQTLPAVTQTSSISAPASVTGAQTLAPVTQSSSIVVEPIGNVQTMPQVTQTSAINVIAKVTGNQTLEPITQFSGPNKRTINGNQFLAPVRQTNSIGTSPTKRRILLGKLPSGNNGLRISQSGYDVGTEPIDNERLIFSSEWPEAIPIYMQGFGRFYQGSGSPTVATVAFPSLGYVPYVEFIFRSPADTPSNQSSWPDTTKYYPRTAINLATWAPYNGVDGAEFFRATISDGLLRFEGERRSQANGFGQNLSWWVYWTIFKKRVN